MRTVLPVYADTGWSSLSGSIAQIARLAKSVPFPDSGHSCRVRQMPVESPI